MVPLLHTPSLVLEKMRGGADLMTPGLIGPPFPAAAVRGALVAVADDSHPTVPQVVGICEIDIASLATVKGVKGHAVRGLHWHGDELWNWSQNGTPGLAPPDSIPAWLNADDPSVSTGIETLHLKEPEEVHGERPGSDTGSTSHIRSEPQERFPAKSSKEWTSESRAHGPTGRTH